MHSTPLRSAARLTLLSHKSIPLLYLRPSPLSEDQVVKSERASASPVSDTAFSYRVLDFSQLHPMRPYLNVSLSLESANPSTHPTRLRSNSWD